MQSTIQLSCHVNSHASVTHDVTSEFITSLHLVKSLHQLRFSYLNFLLEFESTFKTSFPYFFSISTWYFNVLVTSKKKTCPRTAVSQIWLFDGGFKEKIAVPHRIYSGSNSLSYYHSLPEPVYSPPRRIHGRHSKGKEPYHPSPHPLPEKKKKTMTGKWSNPDLLIPRLAGMVITCAIIRDTELASSAMTSVMRRKNYLRRRMLQYGTIIERGLKKT